MDSSALDSLESDEKRHLGKQRSSSFAPKLSQRTRARLVGNPLNVDLNTVGQDDRLKDLSVIVDTDERGLRTRNEYAIQKKRALPFMKIQSDEHVQSSQLAATGLIDEHYRSGWTAPTQSNDVIIPGSQQSNVEMCLSHENRGELTAVCSQGNGYEMCSENIRMPAPLVSTEVCHGLVRPPTSGLKSSKNGCAKMDTGKDNLTKSQVPTIHNRVAQAESLPPAHRWVRSAGTARGIRTKTPFRKGIPPSASISSADDKIACSIREIIQKRTREERATEAKTRLSKRKCLESNSSLHKSLQGNTKQLNVDRPHFTREEDSRSIPTRSNNISSVAAQFVTGHVNMTPQVLVVDGQIVINENSLTVNAAVERTTTISDFTRVEESVTKLNSATYASYTKAEKWTHADTELFFNAIQQFGTDFTLIQRLFPSRSRRQIKNKYLTEDRLNPRRVEAAIKNLQPDPALYQNLISVLQKPVGCPEIAGVEWARAVFDKKENA